MMAEKATWPAAVCWLVLAATAHGEPTPWNDVWKKWSFADAAGCAVEGKAATGVKLDGADRAASLARGGDGLAARLDGGSLITGEGEENLLAFSPGDGCTFAVRCKPDGVLDGSLFTQWPGNVRNSLSESVCPLIDLAAWERPLGRLSRRNLFVATGNIPGGTLPGAVTPLNAGEDSGWLDIVVTQQPADEPNKVVTRVFINGQLRAESELTLLGNGTIHFPQPSPVCLRIGADPGGQFPFRGLIDHVAVWRRGLDESEVAALSGVNQLTRGENVEPVIHRGIPHRYHFDPSVPDEEQRKQYFAALREHLGGLLKDDFRFPAFHLSGLPGCFNKHAFTWKGRHHFFPIGNPLARLHYRHSWFYYNHLSSDDMVHWTLEPPLRFLDEEEKQREYWPNANFVKSPEGRPLCLSGYVRDAAFAVDDNLRDWQVLPDRRFQNPAPEPGATDWRDYGIFNFPGDPTYYLTGSPTRKEGRAYLYRSKDLLKWDYVGVFSELGHQEAPYVFRMDDRLVQLNFSPKGLPGSFSAGRAGYAVGRFENNRLQVEYAGAIHRTIRPTVVYPQIDDNGELVALWQSINGIGTLSYRQDSRKGYGWTYSLPQQVTVNADSSLSLSPLNAVKALRGSRHELLPASVKGKAADIPDAKGSRQEIEIQARLDDKGQSGIVLRQGGHEVRFYYDAAKGEVCLDPSQLSLENSEEIRRVRTCPLELPESGELHLRCFFDGSVFDAYVNGTYYSTWALFDDPREVQAGVICEDAELDKAVAWDMNPAYQLEP